MSVVFGDRILTYLSSLGLGLKSRSLFYMQLPSTPAVSSAIVLSGGFSKVSDPVKRHTLSVLHRNTSVESGLSAINSLYHALNDQWNIACPQEGRMAALSLPGAYTRDSNNHVVFNLSFTFTTTQRWL